MADELGEGYSYAAGDGDRARKRYNISLSDALFFRPTPTGADTVLQYSAATAIREDLVLCLEAERVLPVPPTDDDEVQDEDNSNKNNKSFDFDDAVADCDGTLKHMELALGTFLYAGASVGYR